MSLNYEKIVDVFCKSMTPYYSFMSIEGKVKLAYIMGYDVEVHASHNWMDNVYYKCRLNKKSKKDKWPKIAGAAVIIDYRNEGEIIEVVKVGQRNKRDFTIEIEYGFK